MRFTQDVDGRAQEVGVQSALRAATAVDALACLYTLCTPAPMTPWLDVDEDGGGDGQLGTGTENGRNAIVYVCMCVNWLIDREVESRCC